MAADFGRHLHTRGSQTHLLLPDRELYLIPVTGIWSFVYVAVHFQMHSDRGATSAFGIYVLIDVALVSVDCNGNEVFSSVAGTLCLDGYMLPAIRCGTHTRYSG